MENTELAGTIINISRSGILVGFDSEEVSELLKPNDLVHIVIDLPRNPLYSPRCLECSATLVRAGRSKGQSHIAFEIGQIRVTDRESKTISKPDWLRGPIQGLIQ